MKHRFFISVRRSVRHAMLSAGVLLLAACGPAVPLSEEELKELHAFRPPHQVEHTTHRHLMPVNPERLEMVERQRREIYDFLVGVGARPGDTVILASRRARLDHRAEVEKFIRRLGLRPDTRVIKESKGGDLPDGYDNAILIQFELFLVQHHECGQWGETVKSGFYNTSPKNFGCATTKVLDQQIAYPSSLIRGKTLSYSGGGGGSNSGGTPAAAGTAAGAPGGGTAAQ